MPIDRRFACPNYLVSRWRAPEAMVTVAVSENAAIESSYPDYTYERRTSRWALCWEDERHAPSAITDESEFSGDDIALPEEPLKILPES